MAQPDKCPNPFDYDKVSEGFSCPECGKPQVTDELEAFLWCINKKCDAFALMFDHDYRGL